MSDREPSAGTERAELLKQTSDKLERCYVGLCSDLEQHVHEIDAFRRLPQASQTANLLPVFNAARACADLLAVLAPIVRLLVEDAEAAR